MSKTTDYLDALTWDGTPRLCHFGRAYLVSNTPDCAEKIQRFFVNAVRRAKHPGCVVNWTLLLVGEEGTGKSTFIRVLAGGLSEWGSAGRSRVALAELHAGAWLVERHCTGGSSRSHMKEFLTATSDVFRAPYAKTTTTHPRAWLPVLTSNALGLVDRLSDARRYDIVQVECVDVDKLRRDADQLWAEAVVLYRASTSEVASTSPSMTSSTASSTIVSD